MKHEIPVQEFLISDVLWELMEPLLPVRQKPVHPLGCHRPRVPDRQVLNGIFFVLRTGCQWKALDATGICSGSTAHSRFQEWQRDGFFVRLWETALCDYDELVEDKRLDHMSSGCEQGLCLDAGYDYEEVRQIAQAFGYTTHIRRRGEEAAAKVAGQKARRWVVERTHSWLNRYRRLLVRWEKKAQNYLAMLHLACALITWKQCLFG